jgi:hypothetical protein
MRNKNCSCHELNTGKETVLKQREKERRKRETKDGRRKEGRKEGK